jgi:hypothetical protein
MGFHGHEDLTSFERTNEGGAIAPLYGKGERGMGAVGGITAARVLLYAEERASERASLLLHILYLKNRTYLPKVHTNSAGRPVEPKGTAAKNEHVSQNQKTSKDKYGEA